MLTKAIKDNSKNKTGRSYVEHSNGGGTVLKKLDESKKHGYIFLISFALPLALWWMAESYAYSIQKAVPGSIYAFELFADWHKPFSIVFMLLIVLHTILATAYFAFSKKLKWIRYSLVAIWAVALLGGFFIFSSFGHVEETGISNKSPYTYYRNERLSWARLGNVARLDVDYYYGRGSGRNYYFQLIIPSSEEHQTKRFYISFGKQQHETLSKVLKLLAQNQFHIETHVENNALKEMTRDEYLSNLLNDIKTMTEVKQ